MHVFGHCAASRADILSIPAQVFLRWHAKVKNSPAFTETSGDPHRTASDQQRCVHNIRHVIMIEYDQHNIALNACIGLES